MSENKKSKIWVYAIILFTSAFVILLLTAYTQIKMNRNLNNYKSQISSQASENKKAQQNFSSAQEMNAKLNDEIKALQEENAALKESLTEKETELSNTEEAARNSAAAEEGLSNALKAYLDGNVIECAGMIDTIEASGLDGKLADAFKVLSDKVKPEAGKILFNDGYASYNKGKYADAAAKLELSLQYAPAETYSDKCLYYLAYSELKLDQRSIAVGHMDRLVEGYPDSRYLKSAKRFVEKYK